MRTKQGPRIELPGYESWTLRGYAWRGQCLKSPLTGKPMRAVVGMDEQGRYRPGTRMYQADGEISTVFDVQPHSGKKEAISKSTEMLRERLIDHARFAAEVAQKLGEIVAVRVDARALAIAEGKDQGAASKYGASTKPDRAKHGSRPGIADEAVIQSASVIRHRPSQ